MRLQSEGGRSTPVEAGSLDAIYSAPDDDRGIIQANSLVERNGRIFLDGGTNGIVENSGSLIAKGEVALGFQQLSELLNVPGIDRLGMLPLGIEIITTFSGAVAATCADAPAASALLAFMRSAAAADTILRNGMEPA